MFCSTSKTNNLFPRSPIDGSARIFSYHLIPWLGFEPGSVRELHLFEGPLKGRSTNWATTTSAWISFMRSVPQASIECQILKSRDLWGTFFFSVEMFPVFLASDSFFCLTKNWREMKDRDVESSAWPVCWAEAKIIRFWFRFYINIGTMVGLKAFHCFQCRSVSVSLVRTPCHNFYC